MDQAEDGADFSQYFMRYLSHSLLSLTHSHFSLLKRATVCQSHTLKKGKTAEKRGFGEVWEGDERSKWNQHVSVPYVGLSSSPSALCKLSASDIAPSNGTEKERIYTSRDFNPEPSAKACKENIYQVDRLHSSAV